MVLVPNTYYEYGKFFKQHPVHCKYAASKNGDILNIKKGKIETPVKIKNIPAINIYVQNGPNISYSVGRLVWETYNGEVGKQGMGNRIAHVNKNSYDNRLSNLYLISPTLTKINTRKYLLDWQKKNIYMRKL